MHVGTASKNVVTYSVSDVYDFLQTRVAKCMAREPGSRELENRLFMGFFGRTRGEPAEAGGPARLARRISVRLTPVLGMLAILAAVLKFSPPLVIALAVVTIVLVVDFAVGFVPMKTPLRVAADVVVSGLILFLAWGALVDTVYPPPPEAEIFGISKWWNGDATIVFARIIIRNRGETATVGSWTLTTKINDIDVTGDPVVINDPVIPCDHEKEYYNSQNQDAGVARTVPGHSVAFYYILRKFSGIPTDGVHEDTIHVKFYDLISGKEHDAVNMPGPGLTTCGSIPGLGVSHVVRQGSRRQVR